MVCKPWELQNNFIKTLLTLLHIAIDWVNKEVHFKPHHFNKIEKYNKNAMHRMPRLVIVTFQPWELTHLKNLISIVTSLVVSI